MNGIYGLKLNDRQAPDDFIFIKLESQFRDEFNPQLNPAIIGETIVVSGIKNDYMSQPGVREVSSIEIVDLALDNNSGSNSGSNSGAEGDYISVTDALESDTGTAMLVSGFVVSAVNGIYGLVLQDVNDSSKQINIKLESEFRDQFNPQLNPAVVGAQIMVSGKRDSYMGQPGIRYVESIGFVN